MDLTRIFVRMAFWFRFRPSRQRIIVMAAVALLALALFAIEWAGYWPRALTQDRGGMRLPRI